jgi:putative DNA primase/helicase
MHSLPGHPVALHNTPCTLADLKLLPQWICYTTDKIPFTPHIGRCADCNELASWGTFDQAKQAVQQRPDRYAGVGFEFIKEQSLVGIGLDKCIVDGKLSAWAQMVLARLDSYAEYSPSGSGIHIWARGSLPANLDADVEADGENRIEMYDHVRYFTVTGRHVPGTPLTIEEREMRLRQLYEDVRARRSQAKASRRKAEAKPATHQGTWVSGDTVYGVQALHEECEALAQTGEGSRNTQLNRAAFRLGQLVAGNELARATVERALSEAAAQAGLPHREIERTLRSGLDAGMAEPRSASTRLAATAGNDDDGASAAAGSSHLAEPDVQFVLDCLGQDEWGDSLLFAHLFRGQVLYDHTETTWYLWNGHHWVEDRTGKIKHFVSGKLASVYLRAGATLNERVRDPADEDDQSAQARIAALKKTINALTTRALQLRSVARNKNVLTFTATHEGMGITAECWDRDPWLLAVPNGVLDLRTATLRQGLPEDSIRTVCPTQWNGLDAPCPRFERFLQEIFADRLAEERATLINFLCRLFGYGITGLVREQIFVVLYGEDGRNGKDTLQRAFSQVLGSASGAISKDVLLDSGKLRPAGLATPHLCDLQGKRLAWASEPDKGARFNVGQIKELSGGGDIPVRGLFEKKMSKIKPSHLLILLTNHKPHADANDSAFWDRLHLITFNMRFVDHPLERNERQKDTTLWDTLEQEASGILAWLVRGCLEWQRDGLAAPPFVLADGAKYRKEEDLIGLFLEECCVERANATFRAKALYDRYKAWCEQSHLPPMSSTQFGRQFGKKRFEKREDRKGIYYKGIGPRSDETPPVDKQTREGVQGMVEHSSSLTLPDVQGELSAECVVCHAEVSRYSPEGLAYCTEHFPPG